MGKLLLMSHCIPPIVRGTSVIISRLFNSFPVNEYVALTSLTKRKELPVNNDLRLPCKYYYVDIETTTGGYKRTYSNIVRKWVEVVPIVIKGIKVIKKERCDRILVIPTHGNFFLAAYLINRIMKTRLYVYFFDAFIPEKEGFGFHSFMRKVTQRVALRSTQCAFVMSEKLQNYYQLRHPILRLKTVRHPVDRKKYKAVNMGEYKAASIYPQFKTIVFTGMIYEYQIDSIRNLARAINELNDVQFHIYTQRTREYLESMGVYGDNIIYFGYVTEKEMVRIQKNADILFLPMSFHGPGTNPDVIRTASPGKLAEYLAAERPILVHAPEDAYISWYAKKHGFGLVVDRPDITLLRESVRQLINDKELREELVLNASNLCKMHDVSKVSRFFMKELAGKTGYLPLSAS